MKNLLLIFLLAYYTLSVTAQINPIVTARFSNPVLNCELQTYCVDVAFQSNTENIRLFGMNVRFFFDYEFLSFIEFTDFAHGYAPVSPNPPYINYLAPGAGSMLFGFAGEAVYINGAVQLVNSNAPPVFISTNSWTKLFSICFSIDITSMNPYIVLCPGIVWDLKEDPALGGFFSGSEGVVITIVNPVPNQPSLPVEENVVQFNWIYNQQPGYPFGQPAQTDCINNTCDDGSIVLLPGQTQCFESDEALIVGGNPPAFIVESSASAFLVSATSVILKPGSEIKQGAYFRAWISDEGCVQPVSILVSEAELNLDSIEINTSSSKNIMFRAYPNPTPGHFTLELIETDEDYPSMIEIYGTSGEIILRQTFVKEPVQHFNISHFPPGLYLMRVIRSNRVEVQKLIRN